MIQASIMHLNKYLKFYNEKKNSVGKDWIVKTNAEQDIKGFEY